MGKKIYVGNLNYRTTAEGLQGLFSRYGEVAGVSLVTDRETGQPRGFAFVEMAAAEAATQAIADLDGKEFEGRRLRVNEAVNKPRPPRE
ncbi:MAG: RNA-binding protein [Spirochaetales bacterium]